MLGVAKVGKTWFCATTTKREIWLLSCIKVNYLQVRGERPWSGQAGEQHQHRREWTRTHDPPLSKVGDRSRMSTSWIKNSPTVKWKSASLSCCAAPTDPTPQFQRGESWVLAWGCLGWVDRWFEIDDSNQFKLPRALTAINSLIPDVVFRPSTSQAAGCECSCYENLPPPGAVVAPLVPLDHQERAGESLGRISFLKLIARRPQPPGIHPLYLSCPVYNNWKGILSAL